MPRLKRKIVLSFTAMIICGGLLADCSASESTADALWQIWTHESLPDSQRLDGLVEFIWENVLFSHPDSAYYLAREGNKYAVERKMPGWEGSTLNVMTIALSRQGLYDEALALANQALRHFQAQKDTSGVNMILVNVSKIHADRGNYTKALEITLESLSLSELLGDTFGLCLGYQRIGRIYGHLGQIREAEKYFNLASHNCLDDQQFSVQENLAVLYRTAGETEKARNILIELSKDHSLSPLELASLERELGALAASEKMIDEARDHYKKSLAYAGQIKDRRGLLETELLLGNLELEQGNLNLSRKACSRSLQLAQALGHKEFELKSYLCLSKVAEAIEDTEMHLNSQVEITRLQEELFAENDREAVAKLMLQRDFKEEAQMRLLREQKLELRSEERRKNQKLITSSLIGGLLLSLLIVLLLFQRNRIQKTAEKKLAHKNEELQLQKEELQSYIDRNIKLQEFARVASHDLRTPIQTISNFSALLEHKSSDRLTSDEKSYLDLIKNGSRHMMNLVDGLLTYSQSESEHTTSEQIDTREMIKQTLTNLQGFISPEDEIIVGQLPSSINGDSTRIIQVFQNLISNALKFRRETPLRVEIEGKESRDAWQFWVSDNGLGIDQTYHDKIFQEYERLHTKDEFPGSGLGLAIVKRIVQQHGGEISVDSKAGAGSIFSFTIPKVQDLVIQPASQIG